MNIEDVFKQIQEIVTAPTPPTIILGSGDAILLPSRIKIEEPSITPSSQTVKFWKKWNDIELHQDLKAAIQNMVRQSKI